MALPKGLLQVVHNLARFLLQLAPGNAHRLPAFGHEDSVAEAVALELLVRAVDFALSSSTATRLFSQSGRSVPQPAEADARAEPPNGGLRRLPRRWKARPPSTTPSC